MPQLQLEIGKGPHDPMIEVEIEAAAREEKLENLRQRERLGFVFTCVLNAAKIFEYRTDNYFTYVSRQG